MLGFLLGLFRLVWLFEKGHQAVVLDNLALRQQLSVYKRRQKRPRLVGRDRWFWIALSEVWTEWRRALCIVHPDTSGALAARKIRTGAAFKQIGTGRASPQFSHSHIDSHFGGSQSLVVCVPHSWRTEEARNRGLRTDGVAHPADRQAATLADLENLPPESCRELVAIDVLHELCAEIFEEQLAGRYTDTSTSPRNRSFDIFATGLITNTIPCWLIFAKNRSPSSENVMCLPSRRSRDLVLANHSPR